MRSRIEILPQIGLISAQEGGLELAGAGAAIQRSAIAIITLLKLGQYDFITTTRKPTSLRAHSISQIISQQTTSLTH